MDIGVGLIKIQYGIVDIHMCILYLYTNDHMCTILGRRMQKTCTSCGHKCHISYGNCTKCKVKFISKTKQPVSPSKLERKHMGPILKGLMFKVCKCCIVYI